MKLKKLVAISTAIVIASSTLVGCSNKAPKENKPSSKSVKIGMVADVGGINDESFNQSAWEGLQRAKKDLGVDVKLIESKQASEYVTNMESLLDEDVDLVIGVGGTMKEDIKKEAENYPDKLFVLIDDTYENGVPKNIIPILFKENEAAYLAGLIAGRMTETNKVGFIGGMQLPTISRFEYGYMTGVKTANQSAEIISQYAGTFGDAAKGKSIATQMYGNGVDIILQAAGGTGLGAIEAAKEQNKYAIGVDRDQSNLAPDNILTSVLKKVDVGVYDTVKDLADGKLEGGKEKVYGLKEGGVGLPENTKKLVSKEVLDYVNSMVEKIKKDEIKIPSSKEEYEQRNK